VFLGEPKFIDFSAPNLHFKPLPYWGGDQERQGLAFGHP